MQEAPRLAKEVVVPTREEAEVLLKGLQAAVQGKLVTCSLCGSEVSPKSIRWHEKTQKCRDARSSPFLPSPPSSSSKRKADVNVNTRTKRSRAV